MLIYLTLYLKILAVEQRLIKDGILPMEIVYNHRGFIRECCGIKLPGKHNLVVLLLTWQEAMMARSDFK